VRPFDIVTVRVCHSVCGSVSALAVVCLVTDTRAAIRQEECVCVCCVCVECAFRLFGAGAGWMEGEEGRKALSQAPSISGTVVTTQIVAARQRGRLHRVGLLEPPNATDRCKDP